MALGLQHDLLLLVLILRLNIMVFEAVLIVLDGADLSGSSHTVRSRISLLLLVDLMHLVNLL